MGGVKRDDDKLRYTLMNFNFIEGVGKIMQFGAKKYGDNNWQELNPDRIMNAMLRHTVAICKGEYLDEESGEPHIYHIGANAMMLDYFFNRDKFLDTNFNNVILNNTYERSIDKDEKRMVDSE